MPLVRPILREIVDRYCVSTLAAYAVFHCRLCCCCGCWSNDRSPLDTTQVGRDGGNTSAVPSGDRVRRGLAGHRLSSSRVIPGDRRAFTTAQLRVLWPPFLNTLFAGQPYWRTLSLKPHSGPTGRPFISCSDAVAFPPTGGCIRYCRPLYGDSRPSEPPVHSFFLFKVR